jgi:hypothetical protein
MEGELVSFGTVLESLYRLNDRGGGVTGSYGKSIIMESIGANVPVAAVQGNGVILTELRHTAVNGSVIGNPVYNKGDADIGVDVTCVFDAYVSAGFIIDDLTLYVYRLKAVIKRRRLRHKISHA